MIGQIVYNLNQIYTHKKCNGITRGATTPNTIIHRNMATARTSLLSFSKEYNYKKQKEHCPTKAQIIVYMKRLRNKNIAKNLLKDLDKIGYRIRILTIKKKLYYKYCKKIKE